MFRFIAILNALFLAISLGLIGAAVSVGAFDGREDAPWWLATGAFLVVATVCVHFVPRRDVHRLQANLRELQANMKVEERYKALDALRT